MRVTRPEEPRIGAEKRAEERGVSLSDYWYLWSLGISHAPKSAEERGISYEDYCSLFSRGVLLAPINATMREWYQFAIDWVASLSEEEIENALLIEKLKITVKKR